MAQNITLLGASYVDVPAVELPKTGGGTAEFYDVSETTATASDVVSGKVFVSSTGSVTIGTGEFNMFVAKYGSSTYAEVLSAYQANHIVYCRASSNSNPATGSQTRMAFLAYVNNETTPTSFEFQYYRSVATHSDSQQGDQVYIYKLTSSSGWENSVREAYTKVVAGTGMESSYSSGKITLSSTLTGLPSVSSSDNGKVLRVSNGAWSAESLPSASGVSF